MTASNRGSPASFGADDAEAREGAREEAVPELAAGERERVRAVRVERPRGHAALRHRAGVGGADVERELGQCPAAVIEGGPPQFDHRVSGVQLGCGVPFAGPEVHVAPHREQVGVDAVAGLPVQRLDLLRDDHDGQAVDDRVVGREEHREAIVGAGRHQRGEGIRGPGQRGRAAVEQLGQVGVVLCTAGPVAVAAGGDPNPPRLDRVTAAPRPWSG